MAGVTEGELSPTETTNRDGEAPLAEPGETTDEAAIHDEGNERERTPGLAGGIAIGAVVVLLAALPTSELATAMPRRLRKPVGDHS